MKTLLHPRDLVWAVIVGAATLVANGTPFGNGGVEADALVGLLYNVLQFGLPCLVGVRLADAAVDAGRLPALLAYPAVVLATVGLGVWVIAPLLWPLLGKVAWWSQAEDWRLASSTLVWHTVGMGVYAQMRLAARTERRLLERQQRAAEHARQLAATRLLTLQARVDPALLFERLQRIDDELAQKPQRAPARLAALIDLLRAQQPHLEAELSTLAREVQVLRAYARLMSADAQHTERLHLAGLDAPPDWPLAPMVLLPLVRPLLDAGSSLWSLQLTGQGLRLQALGPDQGHALEAARRVPLAEVRARLAAVQGEHLALGFDAGGEGLLPAFQLDWIPIPP
jgi:hypothetical protein